MKSPFKLGSDLASRERNTSGLGYIQQCQAASAWRRIHRRSGHAAAQNFQFGLPQTRISAYEAQRIPALLQTPAYARALAEADPGLADNDARDRAAAAMLARQKAILGEPRPDIHVVIGEAALRQEVGGPAVMRGQLEMLARISSGSAVGAVQILPFTRAPEPGSRQSCLAC